MSSRIVISIYKPKPGRAGEVKALLKAHVPILKREGLATERPVLLLRSADGTYLEIFEWASEDAPRIAHENPQVIDVWNELEEVAIATNLSSLQEASTTFPHFEIIEDIVQ